jgi:hypothetical protein
MIEAFHRRDTARRRRESHLAVSLTTATISPRRANRLRPRSGSPTGDLSVELEGGGGGGGGALKRTRSAWHGHYSGGGLVGSHAPIVAHGKREVEIKRKEIKRKWAERGE